MRARTSGYKHAAAGAGESWATTLVPALVGRRTDLVFTAIGEQTLKGFDEAVEVVRIEQKDGKERISLSMKAMAEDPFDAVTAKLPEGTVVVGKVTRTQPFGAFVELAPGVEGLVHISELADHHVENPREVVNQGDELEVRIIEIDADRRGVLLLCIAALAGGALAGVLSAFCTAASSGDPAPWATRQPISVSRAPPRKKPAPLRAFLEPVRIATQR